MRIVYYLAYVYTIYSIEKILIDYPGKGQGWLYDTIIFTAIGLVFIGLAVTLYLNYRERRNLPKYPSTVRAKFKEGFNRGAGRS